MPWVKVLWQHRSFFFTYNCLSYPQPSQPAKWPPQLLQAVIPFKMEPTSWSKTSWWDHYERNTFSTSSNNDRTRFFINLILSSLLTPNFKRRSYHGIAYTDLCLATNDSCSTVHRVSLKSFLRTCVTEGCWSAATLSSEGRESRRVRGRILWGTHP